LIGYYELEYIQTRTPMPLGPALVPSPESVGFPPLMTEYEQLFGEGEYFNEADWCLDHMPC
jgi:hypothetical protein